MSKFNIKIFLSILLIIVVFNSCEDFLDVPPTSELESVYFENENRVQRGVGAIYAAVTNLYCANLGSQISSITFTIHPAWLLQGDDLTTSGTNNAQYEAFSGFSPSDMLIDQIWQKYYFIISRANFMLEKLEDPKVTAVIRTEGLVNYNKGEALFLRAYSNYKLWDYFRKAPIQDKRISSIENALLEPSKEFELLDFAIADLKQASELLPETWSTENKGRVFKNSAHGLLVKCYMLRANYAKEYNGNAIADYNNAIAEFEKISNVSTISGVHFGDNFDYRTENNKESLFEFQASAPSKQDNSWLDNNFGGESGSMGAFYHYFDTHWSNYGSGGGNIGPSQKLIDMFDTKDPRRNETFKKAEDVDNVGGKLYWLGDSWSLFSGYQFVKYINGERGNAYEKDWQSQSANNPRLLRLADIKLSIAEAYLKTGNQTAALIQVNDVRTRARFSTPDGTEAVAPANLNAITMQDIMDERLYELAGEEGIRWSDLKRWHAAGDINLTTWKAKEFGYPHDPNLFAFNAATHVLFPIPASEMDSNPLMKANGNNPGYN